MPTKVSTPEASRSAETSGVVAVLVHGAFADGSSWNSVAQHLGDRGIRVIAAANPLRGLVSDAAYVGSLLASIEEPVVLVGHSYGGSVISEAAAGRPNVKALVYVAAFALDAGETTFGMADKFPGNTLGEALAPSVKLGDGDEDLYIDASRFHDQFAADVPEDAARLMAVSQRPLTRSAGAEPAIHAAWRDLPSWFVFGDADRNIPAAAHAFMAQRAHSRQTTVVRGGSHVVMVSNPEVVANHIEAAVAAVSAS